MFYLVRQVAKTLFPYFGVIDGDANPKEWPTLNSATLRSAGSLRHKTDDDLGLFEGPIECILAKLDRVIFATKGIRAYIAQHVRKLDTSLCAHQKLKSLCPACDDSPDCAACSLHSTFISIDIVRGVAVGGPPVHCLQHCHRGVRAAQGRDHAHTWAISIVPPGLWVSPY